MKTKGVRADVILDRDVKLHHRFIVFEKHALYKFHLRPCRCAVRQGHRDVIPTVAITGNYAQIFAGGLKLNHKDAAEGVPRPPEFVIARQTVLLQNP